MKYQKFADDKWQKENDELFTDLMNILDVSKPTPEFNTILHKIYPYFDESRDSSPLLDILDPVGYKGYDEEDDATSENEESHLQMNSGGKDSNIQLLDTTPK